MANNMPNTWGDLSVEQQNFYMEFYAPTVNNVREMPQNNDPVPVRAYGMSATRPSVAQVNAVCDTGDRLCQTINHPLTQDQHNATVAWIQRHLPNHAEPFIHYVEM
jgi:hypothetical protein